MGNSLCSLGALTSNKDNSEERRILRVVKKDGKVLEYSKSVLVKDLLINFDDHCGIASTRNASEHLPPNYELKVGHLYYLLPSVNEKDGEEESVMNGSVGVDAGTKRIKVVISKQQLQQLMSNKISIEDVFSGLQRCLGNDVDSERSWKPMLRTIPEESELCGR